jgi:hypothetical protein
MHTDYLEEGPGICRSCKHFRECGRTNNNPTGRQIGSDYLAMRTGSKKARCGQLRQSSPGFPDQGWRMGG